MALQGKIEDLNRSLIINEAYIRVENIKVEKNKLHFNVRGYVTKESNSFVTDECISCNYDLDASNPYIQAYVYLKTLDNFSNHIDI